MTLVISALVISLEHLLLAACCSQTWKSEFLKSALCNRGGVAGSTRSLSAVRHRSYTAAWVAATRVISDTVLATVDIEAAVRRHRRQARQHQLIADIEDHIGDLHVWPYKEQRLVLSRRPISRGAMFRFTLFLLGNRAPPRPVSALLVGLGLLPSAKKRRDAWDVLRAFRDGTLRQDAFYWCLETNSRQQVHGFDSWCAHGVPAGMCEPLFWMDAQRMLAARS